MPNNSVFHAATNWESLHRAWEKNRQNNGCAGGDGMTIGRFAQSAAANLAALSSALQDNSYRPAGLRLHRIPKPDGSTRPLAIPSVRDRIVQTAVAQALTPVLDPTFSNQSFGYRPGRSVRMAIDRISALRSRGFTHVVEADIVRYFEKVPHDPLLTQLETLLPQEPLLTGLIGVWLEQAGLALDTPGQGLAQGSPLSPILSNLYLDPLDDCFAGNVTLVRFADDFVLLAKSETAAHDAMHTAHEFLAARGLTLDEDGTRVTSFGRGFQFLGHQFIRSIVLKKDTTPDVDRLLAQLEAQDTADAKAEAESEAELAAGYDRGEKVLYLQEPGRRLTLVNDSYSVQGVGGTEVLRLSHSRVDRIEIGPGADFTHDVIRHALTTNTDLALIDDRGETLGWLTPPDFDTAGLHLAQARVALDPALAVDLARRLVSGRLRNMRVRLQVLNRDAKDPEIATACSAIGMEIRKLANAQTVEALRGHEGRAAAVYWPALGRAWRPDCTDFRRQRPATDPLNAAINYLTALLERDMRAAVLAVGLHPGFGALHVARDGNAACVWDLMEGFRALLTEGLAVALFRRDRLTLQMFADQPLGATHSVRISREGQRALIMGYEAAMDRKLRSDHSGKHHAMRVIMREEARAFARHCHNPTAAPFMPQLQDS